jgi:hypothetical protein
MKKYFVALLIISCVAGNAQKHVLWQIYFEPSKENLLEGSIIFEARIDSGFQMFAHDQMPQLPLGVEFNLKHNLNFIPLGEIIAPQPELSFSHVYNMPVAVYKGTVRFSQKIKIKSQQAFAITAVVEDEETTKSEDICYEKNTFVINVKPSKGVRLKFL